MGVEGKCLRSHPADRQNRRQDPEYAVTHRPRSKSHRESGKRGEQLPAGTLQMDKQWPSPALRLRAKKRTACRAREINRRVLQYSIAEVRASAPVRVPKQTRATAMTTESEGG